MRRRKFLGLLVAAPAMKALDGQTEVKEAPMAPPELQVAYESACEGNVVIVSERWPEHVYYGYRHDLARGEKMITGGRGKHGTRPVPLAREPETAAKNAGRFSNRVPRENLSELQCPCMT